MRLILMPFHTLDGVYQRPGAPDEDRSDGSGRCDWLVPFVDAAFENRMTEWTAGATAFLFGHRTYDAFAAVWPTIADPADRIAAQLNARPKFVAATTPVEKAWGPVAVIGGDMAAEADALKAGGEGEAQVHGSGMLGRTLLTARLVDELRLVTVSVVLGQGRRLFGEGAGPLGFDLMSSEATPAGLVLSRFRYAGDAGAGAYMRGETDRSAITRPEG
jgi:dihydrofolate reductase